MRAVALALLVTLAGCTPFDIAPAANYPPQCEEDVYADPTVKDLLMKSAGSQTFATQHPEDLRLAKLDAAHRCMQRKGLIAPGGGVERPVQRY